MDKKWSLVGSAGLGAGVGAGLMYLLDPQGGGRRRAVARDKSVSVLKQGGKAAAKTSRHLGNKTK
ncbi:MAG TPA: polyketide cyclase, partial [Thermoanaerobaculia bacterium]